MTKKTLAADIEAADKIVADVEAALAGFEALKGCAGAGTKFKFVMMLQARHLSRGLKRAKDAAVKAAQEYDAA